MDELCIYTKALCPANQVIEYLQGHRDNIKTIRGWLYSSDICEA